MLPTCRFLLHNLGDNFTQNENNHSNCVLLEPMKKKSISRLFIPFLTQISVNFFPQVIFVINQCNLCSAPIRKIVVYHIFDGFASQ